MQKTGKAFSLLAWLAVAMLLGGCAGTVKNMREVPPERSTYMPAAGKATVVFMRPSGLGFAIQSSVFEVKGGDPTLVGIVAAKTKVAYEVEPGKRQFMVLGENADFMNADLLPGKTYYASVSPRMGMWKARFVLEPKQRQDLDSEAFKTEFNDCKWVELSSESQVWARENLASVLAKRSEYLQEWNSRPEAEKAFLRAEDGK